MSQKHPSYLPERCIQCSTLKLASLNLNIIICDHCDMDCFLVLPTECCCLCCRDETRFRRTPSPVELRSLSACYFLKQMEPKVFFGRQPDPARISPSRESRERTFPNSLQGASPCTATLRQSWIWRTELRRGQANVD